MYSFMWSFWEVNILNWRKMWFIFVIWCSLILRHIETVYKQREIYAPFRCVGAVSESSALKIWIWKMENVLAVFDEDFPRWNADKKYNPCHTTRDVTRIIHISHEHCEAFENTWQGQSLRCLCASSLKRGKMNGPSLLLDSLHLCGGENTEKKKTTNRFTSEADDVVKSIVYYMPTTRYWFHERPLSSWIRQQFQKSVRNWPVQGNRLPSGRHQTSCVTAILQEIEVLAMMP